MDENQIIVYKFHVPFFCSVFYLSLLFFSYSNLILLKLLIVLYYSMDWNRPGKLIRPNPDWEEDLFQTVVVGPVEEERVRSYTAKFKKSTPKIECTCQDRSSPGVAPRITLSNGQTIPNIGIGTWLGLDEEGHPVPVEDLSVQRAVETAIDAGYRLIDTAYKYRTEKQVGLAIKKKIAQGVVTRKDIYVITKLPNNSNARNAVIPKLKMSLEELELDYVDLYLIHWPIGLDADGSYDGTDYLDTWKGMIEARAQALTKAIGVSNFNQHQLDRIMSCSTMKPAVLQVEINLNNQQPSLLTFCNRHNIAVVAYTPFGALFPWRAAPDSPPPREDTAALQQMAKKYSKTVPQIVLRYLVELGVIPIPRSIDPCHIQDNIEVFHFQLSKVDRDFLKKYDENYRMMGIEFWQDSPYYPFEKKCH